MAATMEIDTRARAHAQSVSDRFTAMGMSRSEAALPRIHTPSRGTGFDPKHGAVHLTRWDAAYEAPIGHELGHVASGRMVPAWNALRRYHGETGSVMEHAASGLYALATGNTRLVCGDGTYDMSRPASFVNGYVDHANSYVTTTIDRGGVHINAGILDRGLAAALEDPRLTRQQLSDGYLDALRNRVRPTTNIATFARDVTDSLRRTHGDVAASALMDAWQGSGLASELIARGGSLRPTGLSLAWKLPERRYSIIALGGAAAGLAALGVAMDD